MNKVYDLFCGLGGWSEGFLAEGYECVGFDIEAHDYGTGGYPGKLILRDVRSIHGSELADATIIVASPPCQAYSYRAMPWKRAKALPPPDNTLFNECFRVQREASETAGRHIPLIVENVRGAQKWVGRARWNYGSFYLWGDVPALMPLTRKGEKKTNCSPIPVGELFRETGERVSRITTGHLEGRKGTNPVPNRGWTAGVAITLGLENYNGNKVAAYDEESGRKMGGDWFSDPTSTCRRHGSKSNARKAASAMIAKIPLPLARWIAQCYASCDESNKSYTGSEIRSLDGDSCCCCFSDES